MSEDRWAWLTCSGATASGGTRPTPNGTQVLTEMVQSCDAAAQCMTGTDWVPPRTVALALTEVGTMLVGAAADIEAGAKPCPDPALEVLVDRFHRLGQRCSRSAVPFLRGYPVTPDRDQAWRALQDAVGVIRELLNDPRVGAR